MIAERKLIPVDSSTIAAIGHDANHNVMTVQFKSGAVYEYQNVDAKVYGVILNAPSVGKAFDAEVKKQPGKCPYTKV